MMKSNSNDYFNAQLRKINNANGRSNHDALKGSATLPLFDLRLDNV